MKGEEAKQISQNTKEKYKQDFTRKIFTARSAL
jgi:hypothetical protein